MGIRLSTSTAQITLGERADSAARGADSLMSARASERSGGHTAPRRSAHGRRAIFFIITDDLSDIDEYHDLY